MAKPWETPAPMLARPRATNSWLGLSAVAVTGGEAARGEHGAAEADHRDAGGVAQQAFQFLQAGLRPAQLRQPGRYLAKQFHAVAIQAQQRRGEAGRGGRRRAPRATAGSAAAAAPSARARGCRGSASANGCAAGSPAARGCRRRSRWSPPRSRTACPVARPAGSGRCR